MTRGSTGDSNMRWVRRMPVRFCCGSQETAVPKPVAFAPDGLDSCTSALVTSLRPLRPIPRYILTAQILMDPNPVVIVTRESLRLTDLIEQACSGLTRNLTSEEWKQYLGDTPRQRTCPNLQ